MSREIKFRVPVYSFSTGKFVRFEYWNAGKMCFSTSQTKIFSNDDVYKDDEQFTGLKDTNGKEICEGDIIHIDDISAWSVEYDESCGRWSVYNQLNSIRYFESNTGYEEYPIILVTEEKTIIPEIIGNIHENPELLEEKR